MLYCHMQIHNYDTIKTSDTVLRKIYLSPYLEGVDCERELETEQNCNILAPTILAITAFLSRSPGLLNQGPGGPPSLGAGFLYCILSPTRLIPNCSIGAPEGPFCWVLFSLQHHFSNSSDPQKLIEFLVH